MFATIKNIFLGLVKKLKPKKPDVILVHIEEEKKMDSENIVRFSPVKKENNEKILKLTKFKQELDLVLASKHRNQ